MTNLRGAGRRNHFDIYLARYVAADGSTTGVVTPVDPRQVAAHTKARRHGLVRPVVEPATGGGRVAVPTTWVLTDEGVAAALEARTRTGRRET